MIALLVRGKLTSNKKIISEVLIDSDTSYEECKLMINEE